VSLKDLEQGASGGFCVDINGWLHVATSLVI
jgi:hypothetical protein